MRPLVFLALGLLVALGARAQPSGVYLIGTYSRAQFDGDRLSELGATYSAYFADVLVAPVDFLPGESAYPSLGIAGRLDAGGFGGGISYQLGRATSDVASTFSNGRGNRVQTRTLDHVVTIDLTKQFGPVVVGASAGGMFRGVRVEVATTYPDGAESLGSEFVFNGVYTTSAPFLEAGLFGGFVLADRVFIPVRVLFPVGLSQDRLPALDFDASRNGKQYLPRDFDRYLADPNGSDENAAISDRDYIGPRLQIGVEIRFL